jgi:hypothetical protein
MNLCSGKRQDLFLCLTIFCGFLTTLISICMDDHEIWGKIVYNSKKIFENDDLGQKMKTKFLEKKELAHIAN